MADSGPVSRSPGNGGASIDSDASSHVPTNDLSKEATIASYPDNSSGLSCPVTSDGPSTDRSGEPPNGEVETKPSCQNHPLNVAQARMPVPGTKGNTLLTNHGSIDSRSSPRSLLETMPECSAATAGPSSPTSTEDCKEPERPSSPNTVLHDRRKDQPQLQPYQHDQTPHGEGNGTGLRAETENPESELRPPSPICSPSSTEVVDKGKQREKNSTEPEPERGPAPAPAQPGPPQRPFRPLTSGDPDWEKSADRPPRKLPILLKDAVGRKFAFPWEKAKTWEGMKKLIDSCFLHVAVLEPHVRDVHYDLMVTLPLAAGPQSHLFAAEGTTAQPGGLPISAPTPAPATAPNILISLTATTETPSANLPTPQPNAATTKSTSSSGLPAANSTSSPDQQQQQPNLNSAVYLLPELWEDFIEPGMYVTMHMWPLSSPLLNLPPPSAVPNPHPNPTAHHHHHHHHPPPPHQHQTFPPAANRGRGRGWPAAPPPGRGRGRGRGGGPGVVIIPGAGPLPPPMGGHSANHNHQPHGWMVGNGNGNANSSDDDDDDDNEARQTRTKTRRRKFGPVVVGRRGLRRT